MEKVSAGHQMFGIEPNDSENFAIVQRDDVQCRSDYNELHPQPVNIFLNYFYDFFDIFL